MSKMGENFAKDRDRVLLEERVLHTDSASVYRFLGRVKIAVGVFIISVNIIFDKTVKLQMQWDQNRILHSGPQVQYCYNGKIQSFYAKFGPFPDHFLNFSGLLVIIFI